MRNEKMFTDQTLAKVLEILHENGGSLPREELFCSIVADLRQDVTLDLFVQNLLEAAGADEQRLMGMDHSTDAIMITSAGRDYLEEFSRGLGIDEETLESSTASAPPAPSAPVDSSAPYDTMTVTVDQFMFTVFQIMRKIQMNEIDLQPDFQRHLVWDEIRQCRLIESILIRIPLPAFYLDALDESRWVVVDGLQRLHTLDRFYNKNDLKLHDLEFLQQLNGMSFSDLPRTYQRLIEDETRLNFYIIKPDTSPNVKFTVFRRINTGGMILTAQEIRHSLFQGKATRLLQVLADSDEFLRATASSINTKRMDDRECVLRFLAFYRSSPESYNKNDLDLFLSNQMSELNALSESEIHQLDAVFRDSMLKAFSLFGDKAFRKLFSLNGRRSPINKSLFETWSVCLAPVPQEQLLTSKDRIIAAFMQLMNVDPHFVKSISVGTGNMSSVKMRFGAVEKLLRENLL